MDEETRLVPTQNGITLAEGMNALAPVGVDELATKVVAALDVIAAIIPDLRKPHPATAKKVRGARTVSREAVASIIAMVEASPTLQSVHLLDIAKAHEVLQSKDDYRRLAERLEMLQTQVKYTLEERWAEVVHQAMRAYALAVDLAKDPRQTDLAAHIAIIRPHLGRRNATTGSKKKKKEAEEET
ncbi:MAG TPA: hypothetical protein VF432_27940 [Thermoanaerobaculia bacterium]